MLQDREAGAKATGISTYAEAVKATRINNDYWMKNRTGACKFLNVLQGENPADADDWYAQMKDYCDPKNIPNDCFFNGWPSRWTKYVMFAPH